MNDETSATEEVASAGNAETSSPAVDDGASIEGNAEAASSSPQEAVVTEAAPEEAAAPTEPEQPTLPDFDFDSWDGVLDGLPEHYRPMGQNFESRLTSKVGEYESKMTELEKLNDALLGGVEDPRIMDLTTEVDGYKTQYEDLFNEYSNYRKQIDQLVEEDAQKYAEGFREEHKEYFEDEAKGQELAELIESNWDPAAAVALLKLGPEAKVIGQKAKADGVPDSYALRLAETAVRPRPRAAPRPGAKITSGATASSSPHQELMEIENTTSLDDKRLLVARRALKASR
tara:strand:+ start:685 stop:1545 length:861 start_codon:yes stop_codon:yes gene_type:complete